MNHLTQKELDDLIIVTKKVAQNHPDFVERLRVKMAVTVIDYLDRTQPSWRAEAIAKFNDTPTADVSEFLDVAIGSLALVSNVTTLYTLGDSKDESTK